MRLLPREEKFYALFLKQVEIISEASRLLLDGVRAGNSRLAGAATEISVLEHHGDEVIHEIFTRLNQTFITPIDPEDIHNLSSALDNVLDGIEDTAHRLVSYRIDPIPRHMVKLAEIVASCAKRCEERVRSAGEERADHGALHRDQPPGKRGRPDRRAAPWRICSTSEKDPITLIKLKEIYDFLEDTIDRCEDVADVLQNVVVKNS